MKLDESDDVPRGVGLIGLTVIVLAGVAGPAAGLYRTRALRGKAKITIEQARAIALKAHPGQIADEGLERERGGSGLRYSFDVKNGAVTHEVGVDARTGQVLENKARRPPPQLSSFHRGRSRPSGACLALERDGADHERSGESPR